MPTQAVSVLAHPQRPGKEPHTRRPVHAFSDTSGPTWAVPSGAGPGEAMTSERRAARPTDCSGPSLITQALSLRERDVLQKASEMLTTAEIAEELYVSVNTVKSHLRSSFRKLGVSRRGAAVRRARELQLL